MPSKSPSGNLKEIVGRIGQEQREFWARETYLVVFSNKIELGSFLKIRA